MDEKYTRMDPAEVLRLIAERKGQLGSKVCILGHHYQRDEVFQFADFTGDSLVLSQQAAGTGAKYIVFCGVRFMAESADILTGDDCAVILPEMSAGCEMADLAGADDVAEALNRISDTTGDATVVPITYVNSSAGVKAVTGQGGGACCTSSNARSVFEWAMRPKDSGGAGGAKILAAPDQHLARNTAIAMGYGLDDCVLYDPAVAGGGLSDEQIRDATFILWKGYCYVHQVFTVEQIDRVRKARPDIKVIVHPECPHEVVAAADLAGSTEQILRAVGDSPAGAGWAVGTEVNMVRRLAADNPDKYVRLLSDEPAVCTSMSRTDPPHLLWVLDNLAEGRIVNRISVPADVADDARKALERMISIRTV
ncbi:MAG: quinolinate synthase NadA [Phycisphaerae bacterium]|nr:quinolinate synthase NadA [Phycisphaerae bacterium]